MNVATAQHKAALQVMLHGSSVDERRELLAALGLTPTSRKKRGRPAGNYRHGDARRYGQGCRCTECRKAHAERCRAMQRRRVSDPAGADRAGHGKASTYQNYACRCRPCTEANSAKSVAYKRARREKAGAVS